MKSQKDSAATRQSHRATSNPALAGKPRPSVAQLEARRLKTISTLQGALGVAVLSLSAIVWD